MTFALLPETQCAHINVYPFVCFALLSSSFSLISVRFLLPLSLGENVLSVSLALLLQLCATLLLSLFCELNASIFLGLLSFFFLPLQTIGRNIFSLVTCRLLLTCLGADAERIENVIVHPLSRQSWRPRESHIPASRLLSPIVVEAVLLQLHACVNGFACVVFGLCRSSHHEDRPLFLCRAIFFEKHASHRRTQNPLTGGGGAGPSYLPSSSGNVGQAELARCCWVSSVYEVCISDHERAVSMHEWHSPPIQPW